jgi:hypothetical protein
VKKIELSLKKLLKNGLYNVFAWNEMTKQTLVLIDILRFLRFARNDCEGYFSEVTFKYITEKSN